jgi:hypothetical protein
MRHLKAYESFNANEEEIILKLKVKLTPDDSGFSLFRKKRQDTDNNEVIIYLRQFHKEILRGPLSGKDLVVYKGVLVLAEHNEGVPTDLISLDNREVYVHFYDNNSKGWSRKDSIQKIATATRVQIEWGMGKLNLDLIEIKRTTKI